MYKSNAVLLDTYDSGEYDIFAFFFTQDFGKIQVKARGVKKNTTKQGAFFSSLSLLNISFVLGKYAPILTSISESESHNVLDNNFLSCAYISSFLKLINALVYEYESDMNIWNLLISMYEESESILEKGLNPQSLSGVFWSLEKKWLISLIHILGATLGPDINIQDRNKLVDRKIRDTLARVSDKQVSFFGLSS